MDSILPVASKHAHSLCHVGNLIQLCRKYKEQITFTMILT